MVICRRLYYSERQLPKEVFADRICQLVHQSNSQLWLWWSNVAVVIPSPVSILKCISVAHASYILCGNVYALTWHYQQTLLRLHQSDYSLHSSELFQKMHLLISANRNKKINTLLGTNKQRMSIRRTKVIMPVITQENGFIFKCYFMTQSIFQTTLIPCCMEIILSTKTVRKANIWKTKSVAVWVTVYWPMCTPDPLFRPFVRGSKKKCFKQRVGTNDCCGLQWKSRE